MIRLPKADCTGCGVCANACPAGAIAMRADEEGFAYPAAAGDCLGCGLCEARCPVCAGYGGRFTEAAPQSACAAWSRDAETRRSGSSGGIFSELAREVLALGGYVAGAAFTPDHRAEHRLICGADGLAALKKSKYLQSDAGTVYREAKALLETGRTVLFAGTPCQCAGLRSFLDGADAGLLLCDFICHGVGSPLVHRRYIAEVERDLGGPAEAIDHRDKRRGWRDYRFAVSAGGRLRDLGNKWSNPFLRGFLAGLYLRPACYRCPFKGLSRPTDLTLGDCWGFPGEDGGVSLVLVHSAAGQRLWDALGDRVVRARVSPEDAAGRNPSATEAAKDRWRGRETFFPRFRSGEKSLEEIIVEILGERRK